MREKDGTTLIRPISLTVLIVADDHVNKKIMNPSSGTWISNRDVLPAWIKDIVKIMESVENKTAVEMVINWDDDNNEFPPFYPESDEGKQFKKTKQFEWTIKMPNFLSLQ